MLQIASWLPDVKCCKPPPFSGLRICRANDAGPYHETYRPQFHFSPKTGRTNDPNGLLWFKGEYHLFFHHNPFDTKWGNTITRPDSRRAPKNPGGLFYTATVISTLRLNISSQPIVPVLGPGTSAATSASGRNNSRSRYARGSMPSKLRSIFDHVHRPGACVTVVA